MSQLGDMELSSAERDASLPLDAWERIDRVCLEFENHWQRGERPRIEQHLNGWSGQERTALLQELLRLELTYRCIAGEAVELQQYQERFPECSSLLARISGRYALPRHTISFEAGERVGAYRIERLLGSGSFGRVYLAYDEQLQRQVALKIAHGSTSSADPSWDRLLGEARIAAALRHRHITAIYHADRLPDGTLYVVMEYVAGQSLSQWLEGQKEFRQLAALFRQLAGAVHYANSRGVIHRDLKPSNVLVNAEDQPHILDFGLALQEPHRPGSCGEFAGSLRYMAPEQVRGHSHRLDGRTDVWALGVMLYEALSGRAPFRAATRSQLADEILHRSPCPPRQLSDSIPPGLEAICLKCLEKEIGHRYATAGDMAKDLRKWMASGARVRPWWLSAGVLLLVCLALFPWFNGKTLIGKPEQAASAPAASVDPASDARGIVTKLMILRPPRWMQLSDPAALPLRSGDEVRMQIELPQPSYIYVLWIDARGEVLPVYPWREGDFSRRRSLEQVQRKLQLPVENADDMWVMEQQVAGMETVLVLAREEPLPEEVDMRVLLRDLPEQPLADPQALLWFEQGELVAVGANWRAPRLRTTHEQDSILRLHRTLADRLRPHFRLIHGVSFACRD